VNNLILIPGLQIGVHGKAEDPGGAILAHWKIPLPVTQIRESGLEMEGFGIINGCRNPGILQFRLERGSMPLIFRQKRVLSP